MNTDHGTVVGEAEGTHAHLITFETWLGNLTPTMPKPETRNPKP
jgi:hypothetical protein